MQNKEDNATCKTSFIVQRHKANVLDIDFAAEEDR